MMIKPWKGPGPDNNRLPPSKIEALFKRKALSPTSTFKRDRIDAIVRNVTSETRIPGAIQVYFDHIPQQKVDALKKNYPLLAKCFFDMAQKSIDGSYGKLIQEHAQSLSKLISEDLIFAMALFHACRSHEVVPEVFFAIPDNELKAFEELVKDLPSQQLDRILIDSEETLTPELQKIRKELKRILNQMKLDRTNRSVAVQLFHNFLANAASPSHVMVNLVLDLEDATSLQKSIQLTQAIKNPGERTKAYVNIFDRLLNKHHYDQAFELLSTLKFTQEHIKPLSLMLDRLFFHGRNIEIEKVISMDQIDEFIHLADRIKDKLERQRMLQKIAVGLAKNKKASKALHVAFKIANFEAQSYTLSSIVQALASQGLFKQAKEVCGMTTEPGSKEDAQGYIVRAYADEKLFPEAIEFVQSIQNPTERNNCAKILLHAAAACNAALIVDEVQKTFAVRK